MGYYQVDVERLVGEFEGVNGQVTYNLNYPRFSFPDTYQIMSINSYLDAQAHSLIPTLDDVNVRSITCDFIESYQSTQLISFAVKIDITYRNKKTKRQSRYYVFNLLTGRRVLFTDIANEDICFKRIIAKKLYELSGEQREFESYFDSFSKNHHSDNFYLSMDGIVVMNDDKQITINFSDIAKSLKYQV